MIFFLIFASIPHRLVDFLLFRASERRWESNGFVSLPCPTFHRRNFSLRSFRFFGFSQKSPTFEGFFEDILDFFGGKFCIEHDDIAECMFCGVSRTQPIGLPGGKLNLVYSEQSE